LEKINFGTDGYRAIIAEQFTFNTVQQIALGFAKFLQESKHTNKEIAIGYDTRFLSDKFAIIFAKTLATHNIKSFVSKPFIPTPVLSYYTYSKKLPFGVMITASHNPPEYNGIKFKAKYGGPILGDIIKTLEKYVNSISAKDFSSPINFDIQNDSEIKIVDMLKPYFQQISSYINIDTIKKSNLRIIVDAMYGAGIDILPKILNGGKCQIINLRNYKNPYFDGIGPEPMPETLGELSLAVIKQKADIGIAFDGDADRFGIIASNGEFITLHELIPLLVQYLIQTRGWDGDIVKTTSTADVIDKIAQKYSRDVIETPVGFRYICKQMLNKNILLGGEESGGIGFKNHIPERDGILSALLLLEMIASSKMSLLEHLKKLRKEFGKVYYKRIAQIFDKNKLKENVQNLKVSPPKKIAFLDIISTSDKDGVKFFLKDGSWVLMRISDTEPVGRIYVYSHSNKEVKRIMDSAQNLLFKK